MSVVDDSFDHSLKIEERASQPLAGGIMNHGYQCGMTWGAALAAGAQAYQLLGPGPQAEAAAVIAAQRLVEAFRARNHSIDCFDLIGERIENLKSKKQLVKVLLKNGGPMRCFGMAASYAPVVFNEINASLSENHVEMPAHPISCSALLAQKMGASDLHTVMAAGFAGGIGLSGCACGALGAAIWMAGMNSLKEGATTLGFKSPKALDVIEKFLQCSDYEFECSAIVGRRFENVGEHASYLRDGGCSAIIEVLAAA